MPCSNAWSQVFVLESRAFDSKTVIHTSSFNSTHFTIKSKINDWLGKESVEGRIEIKERRRYLWESSLAWHEELRGQTFCKGNGKRRGEWDSELNLWMTVVFVILGIDLCLLVSLFKPFSVPDKPQWRLERWREAGSMVNTTFKHVHSKYFHIFILYSVLNLVSLANPSSASDRKRKID